jgi:hypothetical protein
VYGNIFIESINIWIYIYIYVDDDERELEGLFEDSLVTNSTTGTPILKNGYGIMISILYIACQAYLVYD